MLKAVVFDMDDTLLDINLSAFIAVIARDESNILAQIGRKNPLSMFAVYTAAMLEINREGRDGALTNRELFDSIIHRRGGVALADPVIAEALAYYERELLPSRNDAIIAAKPMPGAQKALEAVAQRGLRCALFTNPSFSRTCIECRMKWAGIADAPFELVTVMENSHWCKPSAEYYREGIAALGLAPEEVLMVGNDPKRDFPVPDFGLQTAYVGRGTPVRATWCGRMADFAASFDQIEENFYTRAENRLVDLVQDTARASESAR